MAAFHAVDAKQVSEVVTWAAAEEQPLEIVGGGSKRGVGRPLQVEHVLEVSALSGIGEYEPAELVLTAAAATPLTEIEAALDANHQMFACEPADWRTLLGTEARTPTLGGALSCNLAGPRRIRAGAARPFSWLSERQWPGGDLQSGRQGCQKRDRLRPVQAHCGRLRHLGCADRGYDPGHAEA